MSKKAKTIQLLLYDGSLSGVVNIADSAWNPGEMYASPRDSVSELVSLSKYGVYLLGKCLSALKLALEVVVEVVPVETAIAYGLVGLFEAVDVVRVKTHYGTAANADIDDHGNLLMKCNITICILLAFVQKSWYNKHGGCGYEV